MKFLAFLTTLILTTSFTMVADVPADDTKDKIQWYSWEEAMDAMKTEKKKIFIDVYTDWCGWCKRMDKSTFSDPDVIKYINDNYYAVKFNAEQKEDIIHQGHTFKYVANGRRGYHELAASLLDGRLGYPAFVYMDENISRITISPGYKDVNMLMPELTFIADEHFKTTDFETFKANYKSK